MTVVSLLRCDEYNHLAIKDKILRGFSHIADFVPTRSTISSPLERWPVNTNFFKTIFVEKPVPSEKHCTLCYQCKTLCPAGAIDNSDGKRGVPLYDYGKCIRCYCCLEICPEAAVSLKKGRMQWLLGVPKVS
ncbi:MAG: 4Fe-4S dicluster domain-containing protein [Deltaproteobacteria bacterium]|nr:4Fe-4S dicluster domain-containing protein [Deltaproteobacteria bacterium]